MHAPTAVLHMSTLVRRGLWPMPAWVWHDGSHLGCEHSWHQHVALRVHSDLGVRCVNINYRPCGYSTCSYVHDIIHY